MPVLFEIRERLRTVYQRFSTYFDLLVRIVFGIVVFRVIGKAIGFDARVSQKTICMLLGAVSAFLPAAVMTLLAVAVVLIDVYAVSSILALFVGLVFLILYFLLLRYTPGKSYIAVCAAVFMYWGIPYVLPMLFGITVGPSGIVALACGIIAYYTLHTVKLVYTSSDASNPDEALQVYKNVANSFVKNKDMYMIVVVCAVVMFLVYFLRTRKFNYCGEAACAGGIFVSIILFLSSCVMLDVDLDISKIIIFSLLGGIISYVVRFMKLALDYSAVENVQFEDDDYYYYVKAVPKIKITGKVNRIKKITSKEAENTDEEYEDNTDTENEEDNIAQDHNIDSDVILSILKESQPNEETKEPDETALDDGSK